MSAPDVQPPHAASDDNGDQAASAENDRELQQAVRLREQRHRRWELEGGRSFWASLAWVGALGWLIVTPTLLGLALGRWIDHRFETGVFWTGALIAMGVALGGWLAWRRVHHDE